MPGRRWINKKMWVDEYKKELLSDREVLVNMNIKAMLRYDHTSCIHSSNCIITLLV